MAEGVDLDGEIHRADPDRWLASRFISDPARRAQVVALYALDHELARAALVTSNPLAAEIRLVWWRETLEEIFAGGPARRHPVAAALAGAVRERNLPPEPFAEMIEARIAALEVVEIDITEALAWARGAQASLARLAALVLGAGKLAGRAEPSGVVWGLTLLRRAGSLVGGDQALRDALAEARRAARELPPTAFPAALPATLARADLRSVSASEVAKRARLTWAAVTGRL
ncbi:MAG: squalene/phytoene synthase family protein [Caulobacteraceae bacterium]